MQTEVLKIDRGSGSPDIRRRAADALREGRLVVFPTETVYGVGLSAASADGLVRLREIKGAAAAHCFTVHVGRRGDVVRFVPEVSPVARRLVEKGWPGPITLLFRVDDPRRCPVVAELPPAGVEALYAAGAVGLRCPDDSFTADLLAEAGVPVVASSANRAGRPPPVTADEALAELGGQVDLVLDGGRTRYGQPSTLVALNGRGYTVARPGVFDERTIRRIATLTILFVCSGNTCRSPMAQGLARRLLAERLGLGDAAAGDSAVQVLSAGTLGLAGGGPAPEAVEVCRQRGADISGHRTVPLTADLVRSADLIYGMTRAHIDAVAELVPAARDRVRLLDEAGDIPDPLGGTFADYSACADRIAAALERRFQEAPL